MSEEEANKDETPESTECPPPVKRRPVSALIMFALGFLITAFVLGAAKQHYGMRRHESSAIGNLRIITGAQTGYNSAHGLYAASFADLTSSSQGPAFLLGDWSKPKNGYLYTMTDPDGDGQCFQATAVPVKPGRTASSFFFTDCSGVIRAFDGPPLDSSNPGRPAW